MKIPDSGNASGTGDFQLHSLLQGKILAFVFGKIKGLCLGGNPFNRVVLEFSAAFVDGPHTGLAAKNLAALQFCAIHTVGAGAFYFFTKQHIISSAFVCQYYTRISSLFLQLFLFLRRNSKAAKRGVNRIN